MIAALKKSAILIGLLGLIVGLSIACPDSFLKTGNLLNIVRQSSIYGIMAVGMTLVILTGGIDLSVGSTLALAGVVCATVDKQGYPVTVVVAAALAVGALVGLVNGLAITKGKVTPFVVTLGTMSIARGAAHLWTNSQAIDSLGASFCFLGDGEILHVPVPIILLLLSVGAAAVLLARTRVGRYLYAIGGNIQAARLSGIAVGWYTTIAYVLCGLTAGLGAVVLCARLGAAQSTYGTGFELDVIAAVVIGGTSLAGGRGGVWGTLLGALLIGTINNGMNLLQISSYFQLVVKGTIIIAAVLLDRFRVSD